MKTLDRHSPASPPPFVLLVHVAFLELAELRGGPVACSEVATALRTSEKTVLRALAWARREGYRERVTRAAFATPIEGISRAVCRHLGVGAVDLRLRDRRPSVTFARHLAMYLYKRALNCTYKEICRSFCRRDHRTVVHAVQEIAALRECNPRVRAQLEAIERKLADGGLFMPDAATRVVAGTDRHEEGGGPRAVA